MVSTRDFAGTTASGPRATPLVLIAIMLIALNLRTAIMGFIPVLDIIGADLGFDSSVIGLLATIPTLVFGVTALAGPALFRLAGGELLLALSAGVACLGITARSLAVDAWQLGAAFVIAVAGIGIANVVLVPVIKQYYTHRLGPINGLYLGLSQSGPIIAPFLAAVMIEEGTGWRWATGIWAGLAALALLAWGAQGLVVRRWHRHHAGTGNAHVQREPRIRFSLLVRSPLAWGIMLVFSMNSLSTYTLLTLVPSLYLSAGATLTFATGTISVFAVVSTVGSIVVPWLTVRLRPFVLIAVFGVFLLVGLAGLLFVPLVLPMLWIVIITIGLSCFPLSLTLMNLRSRTRAGAASLSGFGQGVGYLIASIGPIGILLVHGVTGNWTLPIVLLGLTVPFSIAAGWFATRPHMIEDEMQAADVAH